MKINVTIHNVPDVYEFFGRLSKIAVQIGNAVPVLFAEKLDRHTLKLSDVEG